MKKSTKILYLIILISLLIYSNKIIKVAISYLLIKFVDNKTLYNNNSITTTIDHSYLYRLLENEFKMPHLIILNKKRTFEKRLPLTKDIKCQPHLNNKELMAFLSLLTKNTTFFETGSGCSSVIAKYYAKKTYAIEGCKQYYEMGIKNGLKNNIIFKDLKSDNPIWSYPGKNSNINDWKNYFQSYKKKFNADVILIDGRFKVATAMDIFNKIRNDTIILIHEYNERPSYFILEEYYDYIYHWDTLFAFIKKKEIKEIPIEIQKRFWNQSL